MRLKRFPTPDAELWYADHDMHAFGLHFPGRMVVVRIPEGGLWLWSPVPIDDELAAEIDGLGRVAWIVAPNRFHHVHIPAVQARYPDAELWGAPGLASKRNDLSWSGELSDDALPAWQGVFEQVVLRSTPSFNEVVFFHAPSRTVICADLIMNLHEVEGVFSRFAYWAEGVLRRARVPRLAKLVLRDRSAGIREAARVAGWPSKAVLMAHGRPLEQAEGYLASELSRAFGVDVSAA